MQSLAVLFQPKSDPPKPVESAPKADAQSKVAEKRAEAVSQDALEAAAKSVEDYVRQSQSDLEFSVDKETGVYVIKVMDPESREVIRQIPAEEIIEMSKRLRAMSASRDASGVLMDAEG